MARLEDEAAQNTSALGPIIGLTREDIFGAVAVLLRETASDPARLMRHGQAMGQDMLQIITGKSELAHDPKDKRFRDPAWKYNPFMRAGMQYYLAVQKDARAELPSTAEEWLEGTEEVAGSWWPFWIEWLHRRSGAKTKAPAQVGDNKHQPLDPAPGTYLMEAC